MKHLLIACLAACCTLVAAQPTPAVNRTPEQVHAESAMGMFLRLCMRTGAQPALVRTEAAAMGFAVLPANDASRFTGPTGGTAWSVQLKNGGQFALALDGEGVCSVYVRRVSDKALQKEASAWLPPVDSGYQALTSPPVSKDGLDTTSWVILRDKKPFARWVLSTTAAADAPFQGVISLRMEK
ncbi:MAG: hypothetical protein V4614_02585 [Pseudomonadota bacterium]